MRSRESKVRVNFGILKNPGGSFSIGLGKVREGFSEAQKSNLVPRDAEINLGMEGSWASVRVYSTSHGPGRKKEGSVKNITTCCLLRFELEPLGEKTR